MTQFPFGIAAFAPAILKSQQSRCHLGNRRQLHLTTEKTGGSEKADYALFFTGLCDEILHVPHPEPAGPVNTFPFIRLAISIPALDLPVSCDESFLPLNAPSSPPRPVSPARYLPVLAGVAIFLAFQYGLAIWHLSRSSGKMANKFSALAKDEYMGFLVWQNLQMIVAYLLLAVIGAFLIQPFANWLGLKFKWNSKRAFILTSLGLAAFLHGFFTLRLVVTRPYFLPENQFGQGLYQTLEIIPITMKPYVLIVIFTIIPLAVLTISLFWQIHRRGSKGWIVAGLLTLTGGMTSSISHLKNPPPVTQTASGKPMNVIIIGSDSLRGDMIGCAGYRPERSDGLAKEGVSPVIDALAAKSTRFEECYTSIASTVESGVQLMTSMYPQSSGIRHMYPDRATVEAMKKQVIPMPSLLREHGYDTAAIGDWCACYYEVVRLGMENLSVSSYDNFKIYMSQAVVMAHFVVPLYFDNPLGYKIFPQLESFANFVTPDVVTKRVENRLTEAAKSQKPFFWHVFYSCNHLPYHSPEPFCSMFADPEYRGPNRHGVAFDIDSFIGGTDLQSKWEALPPHEMKQIRALYDGCTRQFDGCVERILASIKANGLEDNTIVIITADHGDDQYEPGVTLGHGLSLNSALQANHVPLIIHVPGTKPMVIPETVRLIDIMPSLADLIGLKKPAIWQGQSFATWIRNEAPAVHRPLYAETSFPFIQIRVNGVERPYLPPMDECTFIDTTFNYQFVLKSQYQDRLIEAKQRCLKTRDWKLICTPTAQGARHFALFHISKDHYSETDVIASRPEVLAPMKAALERWMDAKEETSIAEIFPTGEPE